MKIDRKEMNGTSEFIIPGFVGIMIFVIIPLVDVFISSFQKSGTGSFAGLQNYALVMENDAFRLAAGNSIRFELVSVPLLIVISLVVAIEVHGMKSNIMKFAFLIPMAIPSNSLTVVWRILFDDQGVVIDRIASRNLTSDQLLLNLLLLVASAFIMYGLRYLWRLYIFGTANHLGRLLRSQLFEHFTQMAPSFYQKYRTGDLMAHATNDINAVVSVAGGGVMSAVDASITALVTLLTMFFVLDWRLTLIAILPLPFLSWGTSLIEIGRAHV